MNKLILWFCILFLLESCISSKCSENPLQVKVDVIDKIPLNVIKEKNGNFYSVKINLINKTDSTVRFWMMTTSWWDHMVFNSHGICFFWRICNHNFPELKKLLPNESLIYNGIIQICDTSNYKIKKSFKIGFIFINKNEYNVGDHDFDIILDKKKNNKYIIWCDKPIILDK